MFSRIIPAAVRTGARVAASRGFATAAAPTKARFGMAVALTGVGAFTLAAQRVNADAAVDYDAVRKTIAGILDQDDYDDGSFGPVFIRLAWHASGTFDIKDGSGGSNGGTMRFSPEADHGANAGLHIARNVLESVKRQYPGISYGDLWTLAGVVAVEEMGGPKIAWSPGRTDAASGAACPPDGRLPDAGQGAQHLRDVFYKMGMNDKEIVALSGAHTFGRCHTDRSGFSGPWTRAPTTFSSLYFQELLNNTWTIKKWGGPEQFEDPTGDLMMLPADMCLLDDPIFKKQVEVYAKDEASFGKDFSSAFSKLLALGAPSEQSSWTPLLLISSMVVLATRN